MSAAVKMIVIEQKATFPLQLRLFTDAAKAQPRDLTGYSAKMTIKKSFSEEVAVLEASSTGVSPMIAMGGAEGTITVTMPATTTKDLPEMKLGVYDVILVSGGSPAVVERLLQGMVTITPGVTDA
jgi:hypothetical protein